MSASNECLLLLCASSSPSIRGQSHHTVRHIDDNLPNDGVRVQRALFRLGQYVNHTAICAAEASIPLNDAAAFRQLCALIRKVPSLYEWALNVLARLHAAAKHSDDERVSARMPRLLLAT